MREGPQSVGWLLFSREGRIQRKTYALAAGFLVLVQMFAFIKVGISPMGSDTQSFWVSAFIVVFLISIWSIIALSVKRVHDIGFSGIMAIALIVPPLVIVAFLALCFWPGDPKTNQYGAPPVAGR